MTVYAMPPNTLKPHKFERMQERMKWDLPELRGKDSGGFCIDCGTSLVHKARRRGYVADFAMHDRHLGTMCQNEEAHGG